jgi:RecJ-like exonuclease
MHEQLCICNGKGKQEVNGYTMTCPLCNGTGKTTVDALKEELKQLKNAHMHQLTKKLETKADIDVLVDAVADLSAKLQILETKVYWLRNEE